SRRAASSARRRAPRRTSCSGAASGPTRRARPLPRRTAGARRGGRRKGRRPEIRSWRWRIRENNDLPADPPCRTCMVDEVALVVGQDLLDPQRLGIGERVAEVGLAAPVQLRYAVVGWLEHAAAFDALREI